MRLAVVFIHGALRHSLILLQWAERLADTADVFLFDLPGHGRSEPIGPSTVEGMGEMMREAIGVRLPDRKVLLVGESLGGVVALAAGGSAKGNPIKAIFAVDPPLTTSKLWQVHSAFHPIMSMPEHPFIHRLAKDVFGLTPDGIEERIYYPLVGALRVPTVIATGDSALLPPRRMHGVACLIDDVDRFVLEQLYPSKAEMVCVPNCGHLLLIDAQDACEAIIRRLLIDVVARSLPQ